MITTVGKIVKAEKYLDKLNKEVTSDNVNELADDLLITLHTNSVFKQAYHYLLNDFLDNGTLVLTNANTNYRNLNALFYKAKEFKNTCFSETQMKLIKKQLKVLKNELKHGHNSIINSFDDKTGLYKIIPVTIDNFGNMTFEFLKGFAKISQNH